MSDAFSDIIFYTFSDCKLFLVFLLFFFKSWELFWEIKDHFSPSYLGLPVLFLYLFIPFLFLYLLILQLLCFDAYVSCSSSLMYPLYNLLFWNCLRYMTIWRAANMFVQCQWSEMRSVVVLLLSEVHLTYWD